MVRTIRIKILTFKSLPVNNIIQIFPLDLYIRNTFEILEARSSSSGLTLHFLQIGYLPLVVDARFNAGKLMPADLGKMKEIQKNII